MELFYLTDTTEDQKKISDFIERNSSKGGTEFLQSYEWGNFLRLGGEEIIRIGVREEDNIVLIATFVKKIIFKRFFYLYAPRGPIGSIEAREFLFQEFNQKNSGALFLRFEPLELNEQEFVGTQFLLKKTIDLQPAQTLILDLQQSEEELLKVMHQKTRYNIRLAQKKGVIIRESEIDKTGAIDSTDLKEFWRLLKTTGQRDNFRLHSFSHYEKLLEINKTRPGFIKLFLAQFEGKNIAAGIFSFYGNKVTYLHGASDNKFRNLMAPYLLQFSLVQKTRAADYLYYDFYGIDEQKWPGVTRFKLGFGGRVFKYSGTYDLIFKPGFYRLYELFRKLKRLI